MHNFLKNKMLGNITIIIQMANKHIKISKLHVINSNLSLSHNKIPVVPTKMTK